MLPIFWRSSAESDLLEIIAFIAQENPLAARKMKQILQDAVIPAASYPYLYRQSERLPGCREIVAHPNYLLLYRVALTHIEVLAVVHTRRLYP